MADFKKILYENVQNCSMFRDGTCDSMLFQQMIHTNKYNRSKHKRVTVDDDHSNTKRSSSHSNLSLEEVPSIQNLKEQVEKLFIREENDFSASTFVSWNFLFYQIIKKCSIQDDFPLASLPHCYEMGDSCAHVFQIDLRQAFTNSLYLTMH